MKILQPFKFLSHRSYNCVRNCLLAFIPLLIIMITISISINYYTHVGFHIALFITGWVTCTFGEYLTHRFVMHGEEEENQLFDFNHTHHHIHPAEIKISKKQRCYLFTGCVLMIILSFVLNNYFTLAAGFICGFPGYTLMHFLLHQKYARRFFSKMVKYHIYHHCKYPDKCFGISVTWWDDLFGTVPSQPGVIPDRIIDFYFKH